MVRTAAPKIPGPSTSALRRNAFDEPSALQTTPDARFHGSIRAQPRLSSMRARTMYLQDRKLCVDVERQEIFILMDGEERILIRGISPTLANVRKVWPANRMKDIIQCNGLPGWVEPIAVTDADGRSTVYTCPICCWVASARPSVVIAEDDMVDVFYVETFSKEDFMDKHCASDRHRILYEAFYGLPFNFLPKKLFCCPVLDCTKDFKREQDRTIHIKNAHPSHPDSHGPYWRNTSNVSLGFTMHFDFSDESE